MTTNNPEDLPDPPGGFVIPPADAPWWRGTARTADGGLREFVCRAPSEAWVSWHLAVCDLTLLTVALDTEYKPGKGAVWFFRSLPADRENPGGL